jgi:hypothetical protein
MKRNSILGLLAVVVIGFTLAGCDETPQQQPQSASGVQKATVQVDVDPNTHMTVEQENVANRLKMDNKPGSVKHLYIISPETGQVLLYSTVKGKVTSSGKRLSPRTVNSNDAFSVNIGGENHYTSEVLEDDGTYGSSVDYIFWWDAQGRYHQHFFTGGQIIHISDYPIAVKNVVLNLELTAPQQDGK